MDRATNTTRDPAVLILDYDPQGRPESSQSREELAAAVHRAFETLRVSLSKRLGREGYRALLTRALTMTSPHFSWLSAARVGKDGALEGFAAAAESQDLVTATHGSLEVIRTFLRLLETFIGKDLTMRLLMTLWPKAIQGDIFSLKENNYG